MTKNPRAIITIRKFVLQSIPDHHRYHNITTERVKSEFGRIQKSSLRSDDTEGRRAIRAVGSKLVSRNRRIGVAPVAARIINQSQMNTRKVMSVCFAPEQVECCEYAKAYHFASRIKEASESLQGQSMLEGVLIGLRSSRMIEKTPFFMRI